MKKARHWKPVIALFIASSKTHQRPVKGFHGGYDWNADAGQTMNSAVHIISLFPPMATDGKQNLHPLQNGQDNFTMWLYFYLVSFSLVGFDLGLLWWDGCRLWFFLGFSGEQSIIMNGCGYRVSLCTYYYVCHCWVWGHNRCLTLPVISHRELTVCLLTVSIGSQNKLHFGLACIGIGDE